jgi:hypothetical protein
MLRRMLCIAAFALVLAPAARADGPTIGATEGGPGASSSATGLRYVTLSGSTNQTMLATISKRDGVVLGYSLLRGFWGVAAVTYDGTTSGLSADGSTLVLAGDFGQSATLRTRSTFAVIDVTRMLPPTIIKLHGDFSVDAVSPHGRTLYLIQHVWRQDLTHYVVRAYDLRTGRLLPRVIADRTQRAWVMSGSPLHRVISDDGRWIYTLYENDGGTPFVHALDSVRGTAHCVGFAWHGSQNVLWNVHLRLEDGGHALALRGPGTKAVLSIDTQTFRVSYATSDRARRPLSPLWFALAVPILLVLGATRFARRRLLASAPGWRTSASNG